MANVKWFVIVDKATGRHHSTCSVDLDDPDTAIDDATGLPYSLSGMKGLSHPSVTAREARYSRKGNEASIEPVPEAERAAWIESNGGPFEALEIPFNPQEAPPDDPEGRYEVDAAAYLRGDRVRVVGVVGGGEIRRRRRDALRRQLGDLEGDMRRRGEDVVD